MNLDPALKQKLATIVTSDDVVLFMKGTRNFPQCGFSSTVVQILDTILPTYTTVNILTDPSVRSGMKVFSDWPTFPQLYVKGEFFGGCDIVREMFENGELQTALGGIAEVEPPSITITDKAAAALKAALSDADEGDHVYLSIDGNFQHALDLGPKSGRAVPVESNGITLMVEAMSARRAEGLTIEFVEGQEGGFKMDNPNRPPDVTQIDPKRLQSMLGAGEVGELIDTRTPREREIASLPNSKLLDNDTMKYLEQIDVKTPVVFYCHHGTRSMAVAEHFRDRGFRNVYNLRGGIDAWSLDVDSNTPRY